MVKTKTTIQKYFRQLVPLSVEARKEYVEYKNKYKSKSDTTNYNKQLDYNWEFCYRCWKRYSLDNHPERLFWIEWNMEIDLCYSCRKDKREHVRNPIIDIEDLLDYNIDKEKLFELKTTFYKKYRQ